MEKEVLKKNNQPDEIYLTDIIRQLWNKRKFILKVTGIFLLIGLFFALFSPVKYTATCTIVPQSSNNTPGGSFGNVAALMGVNLGASMMNEGTLSTSMYPEIIKSLPFTREIMNTPIVVKNSDDKTISLYEYYSDSKYQEFNLLNSIKKYTIGLPSLIFKGNNTEVSRPVSPVNDTTYIYSITMEEKLVYEAVQKSIQFESYQKDGYISLGYSFPEAIVAAQITDQLHKTLEKYITQFKSEKQEDNLKFVEQSYETARIDFLQAQSRLASFQDANRGLTTATARSSENRLNSEYEIAFTVYSELAKQREQAKIAVKENQPIITLLKPTVVPLEKSAPKRSLIVLAFIFFGICAGLLWVIVHPFLKNISKEIKSDTR